MKRLKNNAEVAHRFASRLGEYEGTTNLFQDVHSGVRTIYSYGRHFAIAQFRTDAEGNEVLLFTLENYSNSTSKQIQLVNRATSHIRKVYVPRVLMHTNEIVEYYIRQAEREIKKLSVARTPQKYRDNLKSILYSVTKYFEFLGQPVPVSLTEICNVTEAPEDIRDEVRADQAEARERKKAYAERQRLHNIEMEERALITVEKWRNGDGQRIYSNYSSFDYLRFNADKGRVETSQGVEIPVNIALDFYYIINSIKRIDVNKRDLGTSGVRLLGMYQLNEVGEDFIRVGCHKISFAEIEAIFPVLLAFVNSQAKTA